MFYTVYGDKRDMILENKIVIPGLMIANGPENDKDGAKGVFQNILITDNMEVHEGIVIDPKWDDLFTNYMKEQIVKERSRNVPSPSGSMIYANLIGVPEEEEE